MKDKAGFLLFSVGILVFLYAWISTYTDLQHANLPDIQAASSVYTGRCIDSEVEVSKNKYSVIVTYFLIMEDGRKFWTRPDDTPDDFSLSHFEETALGKPVTLRYVDKNPNWGSLAKEIVELRTEGEVFFTMEDTAAISRKNSIGGLKICTPMLLLWIILMALGFSPDREQRKLSAHRRETKAKRREWLDAHPEEKGGPPSAKRKKDRR